MTYQVICLTDLEKAKAAWEMLSPRESLADEWLYRYSYYQYSPKPLYFYQLLKDTLPVALLPLQKNNEGVFEFFGGEKFYRNSIFVQEVNVESYKEIFEAIKEPLDLRLMDKPLTGYPCVEEEFGYYVLDLKGMTDWHMYIEKDWHGKSRKNIRAQMRKIDDLAVVAVENNNDDLEILATYNIAQFGEKSHFHKPHRLDYLRDLIKHFDTKILSLHIGGKVVAVSFSILYKNRYYGITSGHDLSINNLGKYLIMKRINQAITSGADSYEAGRRDYGWKEHFHFDKNLLYRLLLS